MRRQDWQRRLEEFLAAAERKPFAWGTWDCATFAAAAVEAVTGRDPFPWSLGTYSDAKGARRFLRAGKWRSLEAAIDATVGNRRASPLLAQRGDLVLTAGDELGAAAGVVDLTGELVACLAPAGLVRLPLSAALAAWSVE